ncbi:lipid II:glycine glycyltransferase FemX [Curtobacterium sp. S6]|uniref:lipid II:glycine glycyltransferase FemX n=1 Tax=Curtobacterium sp. S6 TaxID=1479623 RepID=UPI0006899523|nr:GNAT family N-acetyltransferase [Curtobacterium sp. S6]
MVYSMESVLQEDAWSQFQRSLGKRTWQLDGDGWRALCIEEKRRVGSYLYVPYGPLCASEQALQAALRAVHGLGRRIGAWWVRVEPRNFERSAEGFDAERWSETLTRQRYRKAPRDHQPANTRLIDLGAGEREIVAAMSGSNRTIYRNHSKKGLEVKTSRDPRDIEILTRFLEESARDQGIVPRSAEYLRSLAVSMMPSGAATLYSTWKEQDPLCATLVYDSPSQRLFAHAAMPARHRRLRPNQPLISTALVDAARAGQRTADLFGIAPKDQPNHPWAGFSAFKRSFGGEDIAHLGTWERSVVPGALGAARLPALWASWRHR